MFDKLSYERERGKTTDLSSKSFETEEYRVSMVDAPGHRDFVKNLARGVTSADAAILVVSSGNKLLARFGFSCRGCRIFGRMIRHA